MFPLLGGLLLSPPCDERPPLPNPRNDRIEWNQPTCSGTSAFFAADGFTSGRLFPLPAFGVCAGCATVRVKVGRSAISCFPAGFSLPLLPLESAPALLIPNFAASSGEISSR